MNNGSNYVNTRDHFSKVLVTLRQPILMLVGNNLSDLDIDCGGIYSVGQHTVFVKQAPVFLGDIKQFVAGGKKVKYSLNSALCHNKSVLKVNEMSSQGSLCVLIASNVTSITAYSRVYIPGHEDTTDVRKCHIYTDLCVLCVL